MSTRDSVRLFMLFLLGLSALMLSQGPVFAQSSASSSPLQSSTPNLSTNQNNQLGDAWQFQSSEFNVGPMHTNTTSRIGVANSLEDWDGGQVSSVPPGNNTAALKTPLTPREKAAFAFKHAFLSPNPYVFTGIAAIYTQSREHSEHPKTTDDRVVDGLSRWAIKFGTNSSKRLIGDGALPILLHQDPRYHPSGQHGVWARTKYAVEQVFVTYGDNGDLQPNYSRLGGGFASAALANIWEHSTPGHDRIGIGPTFARFGSGIGWDALNFVVLKEFGPDLKRKFLHR